MMDAVIEAGTRLAEALRAENEALAALDLGRAATMATADCQLAISSGVQHPPAAAAVDDDDDDDDD